MTPVTWFHPTSFPFDLDAPRLLSVHEQQWMKKELERMNFLFCFKKKDCSSLYRDDRRLSHFTFHLDQSFLLQLWQRWRGTRCRWAATLTWRHFSAWPWSDQSSPGPGGTSPCAVCTLRSPTMRVQQRFQSVRTNSFPSPLIKSQLC